MHMTSQSAEGEIEGERAVRRTIVRCADERACKNRARALAEGSAGFGRGRRSASGDPIRLGRSASRSKLASHSALASYSTLRLALDASLRVFRLPRWDLSHSARIVVVALAGVAPAVSAWEEQLPPRSTSPDPLDPLLATSRSTNPPSRRRSTLVKTLSWERESDARSVHESPSSCSSRRESEISGAREGFESRNLGGMNDVAERPARARKGEMRERACWSGSVRDDVEEW